MFRRLNISSKADVEGLIHPWTGTIVGDRESERQEMGERFTRGSNLLRFALQSSRKVTLTTAKR